MNLDDYDIREADAPTLRELAVILPENDARFWRQFADHWRSQVVINDERPITSRWAITGASDTEAFIAEIKRAIESARKDS